MWERGPRGVSHQGSRTRGWPGIYLFPGETLGGTRGRPVPTLVTTTSGRATQARSDQLRTARAVP